MLLFRISFITICFFTFSSLLANTNNIFSEINKGKISFKENKGQVRDQNFQPRHDVLFSGATGNFSFYLKNDGLHYQLSRIDSWKKSNQATVFESEEPKLVPDLVSIYRVDVNWKGANKNAKIEKGDALEGYDNYYNVPEGVEPALFVKSYTSLTYKNIYNGIDLKFYESKDGGLEYDFIVQPNANYRQIALEIKGAELSVNEKQELIIKTPLGEIVEGALAIYQDEKQIAGKWMVEGQTVRFNVTGLYDQNKPLRIDPPVRVWGTYAGTRIADNFGFDFGFSCSTDPTGNVFMAGTLEYSLGSTLLSNIVSAGAHQTTFQNTRTAFLMKFNENGVRQWGTFYAGNFDESGNSCAADANGNVFLAGTAQSTMNIATPGAHQTVRDISDDAFLVKFNAAGVRQWGTYFGKEYGEQGKSVTVDNSGNVYMSGTGGPSVNFGTSGTHQQTGAGGTEAFLVKFNTNGTRLWSTVFGGSLQDEGAGCNTDASGNVYLTGWTSSTTGIATPGASQTVYGGDIRDLFIAKFNSNGGRLWSTYLGGPGRDFQWEGDAKPAIDAAGNVYISGWTNSTIGMATPGAYQITMAGNTDAILAKWNATGALQWCTYYGGSGVEEAFSSAIDAQGNVYFVGGTRTANIMATVGAHQTVLNNGGDGFLAAFDGAGQRLWGTYYGGNGNDDKAWNVTVHQPSGAIYICGQTNSTTDIATPGAHQTTFAGNLTDAFLVKFRDCPSTGGATITTNSPVCVGQNLNLSVPAVAGATYTWAGPNGFNLFNSTTSNPTINNVGVNASGLYGVTVTANGCPGSLGTVNVTVTPAPTAPNAVTLTPGVCRDSVARFEVTSAGTTFNWYATNTSTTILGTGITFTSPPLTASTSYFIERVENGCPSPRTQVFVQVITAPDPTPANTQICAGSNAIINSNISNAFTVNWYDAPNATTPIFSGSIFTTPILNSNTTYYAQTFVNGCPSARVPVTVTVVTPPVAPTVNGTTICAGQTATLNVTAPSGATFGWFSALTGGTAIFTGSSFTTPTLNSNTTYYVEAQVGSCNSATRTSVVVNVNPTPATPTAAGATICSGQTTTLNATAPANVTFNWYANATGGTALQSNASFTTPVLTTNTTYYVEAANTNCASVRTAVTVTVNQPPVQPTVAAVSICQGETATLTATAPSGATFNWYDVPNAGSLLQSGNTFTTPNLNTNTTYYVASFNGCTSARTSVVVTVNIPPVAPTIADTTICSGQTATLTPTAPAGVTFLWFSTPNGGSTLSSGNTFTTQPLNNTTTFYVASEAAGCPPSVRTPVAVNVDPTPSAPVVANTAICSGETATLTATAPSGVSFEWFATATGGTTLQSNASFTTPVLTATTTYYIASVLGNCVSGRTAAEVVVNQPPTLPTANNTTICEGETATLSATSSAGAIINWYDANTGGNLLFSGNDFTTLALTTNASYFVQAEATGCPPTNSVEVIVTVLPTPAAPVAADLTICSGTTASLSATAGAGATIQWYSSATGGIAIGNQDTFATAELFTTTTFYASAQLGNCPSSQRTPVVVNVLPTPEAAFISEPELTRTVMVSQAEFTFFNNTLNGTRFVWNFGDGDSLETFSTQEVTHKYAQPGSYTVTLCAYSSDGCSNCVTYENITVVEDYAIYIPNVFTPNGDGNNDVFQYHLIGVKKVFIYVFNRWGEKVFETDNPNEYWDGTYKGKLLNPDVFVYQIKLVSYDNKQAEFKGSVSILK